ncbi:MAG: metalloregulator ArsR/SmtB family transcription factor [Bdellovibrionales bacterium]
MKQSLDVLLALAEPTRYQAVSILWDGRERCVCELIDLLDKSQSCVSRHMTLLKRVGLVVDRRDAQWVRYRRNPDLSKAVVTLIEAVLNLEKPAKRKAA